MEPKHLARNETRIYSERTGSLLRKLVLIMWGCGGIKEKQIREKQVGRESRRSTFLDVGRDDRYDGEGGWTPTPPSMSLMCKSILVSIRRERVAIYGWRMEMITLDCIPVTLGWQYSEKFGRLMAKVFSSYFLGFEGSSS